MTIQNRILEGLDDLQIKWNDDLELRHRVESYDHFLAERIKQFGLAMARHYCWALSGAELEKEIKQGIDVGIKALGKEA